MVKIQPPTPLKTFQLQQKLQIKVKQKNRFKHLV